MPAWQLELSCRHWRQLAVVTQAAWLPWLLPLALLLLE
jgi:hypothetical protein